MNILRKRLLVLATLLLTLLATVSPTSARWQNADIGFVNMERVCRDGALVSMASGGSAGAIGTVGARRHDNLAATPEPAKAFGGTGTPRPPSDYGPNIVAEPALRTLTVAPQTLAREVPVSFGNGAPDITHSYGVVVLPWSALQTPGTPVVLVYRRSDNLDVGISEEIVADCLLAGGSAQAVATSALPGADAAIPAAQLTYQVAGWPSYGLLLRDDQPLGLGTRFAAADLAGHPLSYATSRPSLGALLPVSVFGTDLVSRFASRTASTLSANSPAISSDGRYVAFESLDATLASSDTNDAHDIFVYDRQAAQTSRVSVSSSGTQANDSSTAAAISGDGRYVAFQSSATNLVAADTNTASDVFVRDRQTNQTTRVSVSSSGAQADGASTNPAISADGRYVAFVSSATNLVSGDTNGHLDIFVRDQQTSQTTRISVGPSSAEANGDSDSPALSGNGRYVAFRSDATNVLAVSSDTNTASDIFVYDQQSGQTSRVSVGSGNTQANGASSSPSISQDGSAVAFASNASNLTSTSLGNHRNIYVYNRTAGITTWASHALDGSAPDNDSDTPSISGNGRLVAFVSSANNLVGYDVKATQDVFLYDLQADTTTCLSVSAQGSAASSVSLNPAISADGRFTAIESYATNLLPNPIVSNGDIYVRYQATANVVVGTPYQLYIPLTSR